MEENNKISVDEIVEHGVTLKEILSEFIKDLVVILIVSSVIYLSIHNNTIGILESAFNIIIGFYIANKASSK
jgi:hypothetical protein